jgi:snRNA-activating protein complex subunit 3
MHDTPLSSLSLRVGEPYWLLHHGNCEHFIVIDQIRYAAPPSLPSLSYCLTLLQYSLQHPSDPPSGYPLTIQFTPPLLDVCRACARVPAVYSIVNDARLGETPCPMCGPCWSAMGEGDDGVVVVPFPRYELGW